MSYPTPRLWKVNCMEDRYPGMWQRWFMHQAVAVGWYSGWGYKLEGVTRKDKGWLAARSALRRMEVGDWVLASLKGHRVGRLGVMVEKRVDDDQWDPFVPPSARDTDGEMGRRVLVRWDLTLGPDDRERVVALPPDTRFTSGELRPTVSEIKSVPIDHLRNTMRDEANWESLRGRFRFERALSDYIAAFPHRLEDGMLPHPDEKIRERVFHDRTRLDVLLIDRDEHPVIVECKQYQPSVEDIRQLRRYMDLLEQEAGGVRPRGILVHGGARKIPRVVVEEALLNPAVEVVQYQMNVDFVNSV